MPDESPLSETLSEWLESTTFPTAGSELRCGVSGGADSLALMALGVAAGCEVTAVHVDHGQRSNGSAEAQRVEVLASSISARFESAVVDVAPGANLEARMRSARYEVLGPGAATGHTADDQAETLLINLVRGAGLVGLGAMVPGSRRPILALRRADTEAICERLGWQPFIDPSNENPVFQRNRMRLEIIPRLNDVAGRDVVPLLVRSARHARDAAEALHSEADALDPTDAVALAAAPKSVAAAAVQRWIREETGADHPVDSAAIGRVLDVAAGDAVAAEILGGWRVSRSRQRLSIS